MTNAETLKRTLEVAIVLAVITQLVSLTDFFLLPPQKKRLEGWCDDITLRLSYVNTAGWLRRWLRTSRRAHIGQILFTILTSVGALFLTILEARILYYLGMPWWVLGPCLIIFLLLLFWAWNGMRKVFNEIGPTLFGTLSKGETISKFILIYLSLAMISFVGLVLMGYVFGWLVVLFRYFLHYSFRDLTPFLPMYPYFGMVVTWVVFFLDGLITLAVAALLWPVRFLVISARGFMWRVASYPKGPLAALIAVAGAILAIVRVSLGK